MLRFRTWLLAAPLVPLLAGCHTGTVTVTESHPQARVVVVADRDPEPDLDVVVDVQEDDVSFVVYREYYGCSEEEIRFIPYYRRYYRVDDCDLFFLFHVARHMHRPIDFVIRSYYYDCDRDYDRLIVTWHVDRTIFFVDLPGSYHPGGEYDRPYRLYREHSVASARFSNTEFRVLVSLKIGVEYQGVRAEQFVERVREHPASPQRAVLRSHESLGSKGRNVEGRSVSVQAPRPWTMPEQEGKKYRQERKREAEGGQKAFQEKHGQRVNEARKGQEKQERPPKDVEREKAPKDPKDVEREKAPRDPKGVEREKAPKDPKDVEREKAPRDPKDAERTRPPKDPKDVERENPPRDPKEVERQKNIERQQQLERDQKLEHEKELERQKEIERLKEVERQKHPPKDPKDTKDPKKPK
jgi:hypothetical protein